MLDLWLEVIGSLIGNTILFMLIPMVWWLIFYRKEQSFFSFIGLAKPKIKSLWLLLGFAILFYSIRYIDIISIVESLFGTNRTAFEENISYVQGNESMQHNAYTGMGVFALLPLFIQTLYANGVCEEAFFRGFVLKRVKKLCGLWPAIIFSAVLFAFLHNGMFWIVGMDVDISYHLFMFLGITITGIMFGVLNEIVFDGRSIVPSVLLHGLGNFIAMAQF